LLANTTRANSIWGTGVHVMGRIKKKFLWDVAYGNSFGLYRQSDPAHEVYLHLLWVPWEKEVSLPGETPLQDAHANQEEIK
jgi:hypothetical protein